MIFTAVDGGPALFVSEGQAAGTLGVPLDMIIEQMRVGRPLSGHAFFGSSKFISLTWQNRKIIKEKT